MSNDNTSVVLEVTSYEEEHLYEFLNFIGDKTGNYSGYSEIEENEIYDTFQGVCYPLKRCLTQELLRSDDLLDFCSYKGIWFNALYIQGATLDGLETSVVELTEEGELLEY